METGYASPSMIAFFATDIPGRQVSTAAFVRSSRIHQTDRVVLPVESASVMRSCFFVDIVRTSFLRSSHHLPRGAQSVRTAVSVRIT